MRLYIYIYIEREVERIRDGCCVYRGCGEKRVKRRADGNWYGEMLICFFGGSARMRDCDRTMFEDIGCGFVHFAILSLWIRDGNLMLLST